MNVTQEAYTQFQTLEEHLESSMEAITKIAGIDYADSLCLGAGIAPNVKSALKEVSDIMQGMDACVDMASLFDEQGWVLHLDVDFVSKRHYTFKLYLDGLPECQIIESRDGFPCMFDLAQVIERLRFEEDAICFLVSWVNHLVEDDGNLTLKQLDMAKIQSVAEQLEAKLPSLFNWISQFVAEDSIL